MSLISLRCDTIRTMRYDASCKRGAQPHQQRLFPCAYLHTSKPHYDTISLYLCSAHSSVEVSTRIRPPMQGTHCLPIIIVL